MHDEAKSAAMKMHSTNLGIIMMADAKQERLLDAEEQAFDRYVEAMLDPLPTRARPVLQKRRAPKGLLKE